MATFRPVRGERRPTCAWSCPHRTPWAPSSSLCRCPHHIHTRLLHTRSYKTITCPDIFSLLVVGSWGCVLGGGSTSERESLGAVCAAQSFSGVQRRWRLEKAKEPASKTHQCAHAGTLEPRVGHRLHRFPPL